ncbi:MAG: hypothetical protein FWF59_00640 [Turicibacter sp.]|nr:hypothetical protein [Turicibacter sp.]
MKMIYKQHITELDRQTKGIKCISTETMDKHFGRIGCFEHLPKNLIQPKTKNRICHVFWSKPYKMDFTDARWNISNQFELTLPLCALSLSMLKEMGQEVVLYTDSDGAELLKDLGYDRIYTIFDKLQTPSDFWACGKILALQNEPLDSMLVDTDIFLYDGGLLDKAHETPVVGSHFENTASYKEILKLGQQFFDHLQGDLEVSINSGFLKVHDFYKKSKYISAYWAGIKAFSNPLLLNEMKVKGHGAYCPDLLIEQLNFYKLCQPEPLIELPQEPKDAQGFVHLLSFEKYLKIPMILDLLKDRYPRAYGSVIKKWEDLDFSVWLEDVKYQ